ncbi:MAG TPA: cyclase family protein [Acidimicrobiales bacterium]|nr:cyclase family protein [Acidimicrobiales bacterium]
MYVDLSFPIVDGMPTYPGFLPEARVGAILDHEASRDRYQGKAEFHLARVEIAGNTGTYLDVPFHRYPDGDDAATVPLDRLVGLHGVVVNARGEPAPVAIEAPPEDLAGRAVLVRTGWDERWGTEAYWEPDPWLSAESVDLLVDAGAALVGVDWTNVDDTTDPARPAHTRLLGAGVLIVEHLTGLGQLPTSGFRFTAVPPRIAGVGAFPVRAFAEIPDAG